MPRIEVDATTLPPLGMPPERFLRDYWQKRPLLIRGAFSHWTPPIEPEDLAGLACEELALSRLVEHDRGRDRWSLRHGPFAESDFPALPERDWTLLVQDVDKWDADVRGLLGHFDFIPRWRIDDVMVSYAAPGGSVGAHVDHYDVFLLQGHGRRRWQIDGSMRTPRKSPHTPVRTYQEADFRDDTELKLLREFRPSHDWLLAPGDMLYLPPGVPHHGVAEDACLTFSIGMRAPALAELVGDFADDLAAALPEEVRYADPDLAPAKADGEIDARSVQRVRALLERALAADERALGEWLGRFLTRYRSAADDLAPPRPPSRRQIEARLARGDRLQAHPFARFAWLRQGRNAVLFVHGRSWSLPRAAAIRLCDPRPIDADTYRRLVAQADNAVQDLLRSGFLVATRIGR